MGHLICKNAQSKRELDESKCSYIAKQVEESNCAIEHIWQ